MGTKRIFLLGCPGAIGGACTEAWALLRLWRGAGADVTVIPTWGGAPSPWHEKMEAIGCKVINLFNIEGGITNVPGIASANVVGMCNEHYWGVYRELIAMECRTIWLNCMTFWFESEINHFRRFGMPTHLVFQSDFQKIELEKELAERIPNNDYDPSSSRVIRGAFALDEWAFTPKPHPTGSEFVLGKIARKDLDKWSSNLWSIMGRVQYPQRKALVMGVEENTAKKLGATPEWATWLKEGAMPVQEYYQSIHCLMPINGGARENFPRVGLEAMAAGVPIVAQRAWGWPEMIEHGETGFLGESDEELAHWAGTLAWNEPLRMQIADKARSWLGTLTDPATLWKAWEGILA